MTVERPKVKSESQKELDKVDAQFKEYEKQVDELTLDRMNKAPKLEVEPQTKLASSEIEKKNDVYLKPKRTVASKEKFNEAYRDDYNFKKEYVNFIAEHKELIGESIEMWTKPFPGMPAEEWIIPANKPVWAPRYVAEQIKNCSYHRMRTEDRPYSQGNRGDTYYGTMVVDNTIQRLDAYPVGTRKSIFMGANNF